MPAVRLYGPSDIAGNALPKVLDAVPPATSLSGNFRWLHALRDGLGHLPYLITREQGKQLQGTLPLALVQSRMFGRFLVGLPYLSSGGALGDDDDVRRSLVDRAVQLADELDVRHLELRHEVDLTHPSLINAMNGKVHMRLPLPTTVGELWTALKAKVRNQVRKGESHQFQIEWGALELLEPFYAVFSRNMRDLGTPVFGRKLFRSILACFPGQAEFCILRHEGQPAAAALLLHGSGVSEVPSASTIREFNSLNANMVMYWKLLSRAIERGQYLFDFGRSTVEGNTFKFKKQWGAIPHPAVWQYYVRRGKIDAMRPESGRFRLAIRVWQQLPVWVTQLIGPSIVRGIP